MTTEIASPLARNGLPADSAWLFPEHNFDVMNPDQFASVIIERVLERGTAAQIRWLVQHYGQRAITAWVRRYGYRRLSRKVFEYWRWVFGIKRYQRPPWERNRARGAHRP